MKPILACLLILTANLSLAAAADQQPQRKLTFERDASVYLANLDGSNPKKISRGQCPELSSDGTKLAFNTVQEDGQPAHRKIAIYDCATARTAIFDDVPSDNCMEPRWSADGKQLLFAYYANNDRFTGVINADGTGFRCAQTGEEKHHTYWSATWAADGQSIFAQDMENLYRLDLSGKVLKKWPVEKIAPRGGMSGGIRLDASPDGKTLLMDVEMDEKERKGWDGPPASIWLLDLASEKATRLTPKDLYAWDCKWLDAPDSILFVSQGAREKTTSVYQMTTTKQGKDRQLLAKDARCPSAGK
jgi:TolB protein